MFNDTKYLILKNIGIINFKPLQFSTANRIAITLVILILYEIVM